MNTDLLNKSLIGRDFLRLKDKKQPSIDVFLDWRNQLNRLKNLKKYPAEWYQLEIEATDEIIKFLSGATVKREKECPRCKGSGYTRSLSGHGRRCITCNATGIID